MYVSFPRFGVLEKYNTDRPEPGGRESRLSFINAVNMDISLYFFTLCGYIYFSGRLIFRTGVYRRNFTESAAIAFPWQEETNAENRSLVEDNWHCFNDDYGGAPQLRPIIDQSAGIPHGTVRYR
jgi:hypothetical protein